MKTLYLECSMGAAGDMLTAALLELHPEPAAFLEKLNAAMEQVIICRMVTEPATMKEFRELAENCTLYWATLPSLGTVMQFTSKVPGYTDRSIILPVGGFKDDTPGITPTQSSGQYWTSQIHTAYSWDAHMVRVYYHQNTPKFDDSGIHKRFRGLNIRPVW